MSILGSLIEKNKIYLKLICLRKNINPKGLNVLINQNRQYTCCICSSRPNDLMKKFGSIDFRTLSFIRENTICKDFPIQSIGFSLNAGIVVSLRVVSSTVVSSIELKSTFSNGACKMYSRNMILLYQTLI